MTKYHVNEKGEAGACRATKRCPFGDLELAHYATKDEARAAFEEQMKEDLCRASTRISVVDIELQRLILSSKDHSEEERRIALRRLRKGMDRKEFETVCREVAMDKQEAPTSRVRAWVEGGKPPTLGSHPHAIDWDGVFPTKIYHWILSPDSVQWFSEELENIGIHRLAALDEERGEEARAQFDDLTDEVDIFALEEDGDGEIILRVGDEYFEHDDRPLRHATPQLVALTHRVETLIDQLGGD